MNGLLLESMAICLCIVEPMLTSVRLGSVWIPTSFACSFKKCCWVLSWFGTELHKWSFVGNLIGRFAVDIGRFIRESLPYVSEKDKAAKSALLKNKLLEQMEAKVLGMTRQRQFIHYFTEEMLRSLILISLLSYEQYLPSQCYWSQGTWLHQELM